jgi:ankyrin repeat protein
VQDGDTPLLMACNNGHMEVVKLLLARSDVAVNKTNEVRRRGGVVERDGMEGREAGCTLTGCGGGWLTSHSLTMLSWGALLAGMCRVERRRCTWPVTTATWRW